MRHATPEMLIDFLPAPDEIAARAAVKIYDLLGTDIQPGWLDYGTAEGWYRREMATVDHVPAFVIWWSRDCQNFIVINACVSISDVPQPAALALVAELIAKREKCRGVILETVRPGLVRQSMRFGYKPTGIKMRKIFA